jgi:hypothetical protein
MSRYDRWGRAEMPEGEALRRIQRGINETMAAVVVDRYNPVTSLPSAGTVTLPNAPEVTDVPSTSTPRRSDRDTIDLRTRPSYADRVVGAMIDEAFPPPPPTMAARIARLSPEQRAEMAEWAKDQPGYEEIKAMLEGT